MTANDKLAQRLDNGSAAVPALADPPAGLQRLADLPIYSADALVRRAPSLQLTADARAPMASSPCTTSSRFGR